MKNTCISISLGSISICGTVIPFYQYFFTDFSSNCYLLEITWSLIDKVELSVSATTSLSMFTARDKPSDPEKMCLNYIYAYQKILKGIFLTSFKMTNMGASLNY